MIGDKTRGETPSRDRASVNKEMSATRCIRVHACVKLREERFVFAGICNNGRREDTYGENIIVEITLKLYLVFQFFFLFFLFFCKAGLYTKVVKK